MAGSHLFLEQTISLTKYKETQHLLVILSTSQHTHTHTHTLACRHQSRPIANTHRIHSSQQCFLSSLPPLLAPCAPRTPPTLEVPWAAPTPACCLPAVPWAGRRPAPSSTPADPAAPSSSRPSRASSTPAAPPIATSSISIVNPGGPPIATSSVSAIIESKPIPSSTASVGMDSCASKCYINWQSCNAAPNTNKATCYADFSKCIGYDAAPETHPDHCSTTLGAPTSMPTPTGSFGDDCARKCVAAFDQCNQQPDCNHSDCAAKLSRCVGYNPFQGGYVQPTTCQNGLPHPGGNATTTDTVVITTTFCPAGQTQTTTETWTITACPGGCSGSSPTSGGSSGSNGTTPGNPPSGSTPAVAGAGRIEIGSVLLLAAAGAVALL